MNGLDTRAARGMMAGLVAAGVVMAAIGATAVDPQVVAVLPPIGAALVAAGLVVLLDAERLRAHQAVIVGASLVLAGVVMAVAGSAAMPAAVSIALVPLGGALATAGTITLISGTAVSAARAGIGAR